MLILCVIAPATLFVAYALYCAAFGWRTRSVLLRTPKPSFAEQLDRYCVGLVERHPAPTLKDGP